MARDYFAVLGLAPGRYDPRDITGRFYAERARWLGLLDDSRRHAEARERLDELHIAYAALRDPRRQAEYLRALAGDGDPQTALRALIAASLEDGLLRYSRRQAIVERAREFGFNDFQAQLLIAQTQFGEEQVRTAPIVVKPLRQGGHGRVWARVAGVGVLAAAMFAVLVHWLAA